MEDFIEEKEGIVPFYNILIARLVDRKMHSSSKIFYSITLKINGQ